MLVAQNSLGPVCPVPLTVRGRIMPTPFVVDAAEEAVRSNTILNERKATDIIEETALEVDIRAWRAEGLRLLQAASAREDHVPNGARRPCSARCVVLSELRKSHFLRAIGVVSSSAMAATSRVVKRARYAKCSLAKTPRGAIPTRFPDAIFFLAQLAAVRH